MTSINALVGSFFANPGATSTACQGTTSGRCCYQAGSGGSTVDGGTTALVSAGTITVKDGNTTIASLSPGANGSYNASSYANPSLTWNPGDTLGVSAAGGTVHPFNGTITTPAPVTGVSPAMSSANITISQSTDFTLSWTPSSSPGSQVTFTLAAVQGGGLDGSVTCVVDDSAGSIIVSKTLLGRFNRSDSPVILDLVRSTSSAAAGDNVTVALSSSGPDVSGGAQFGP
jgi:hypothetical protein